MTDPYNPLEKRHLAESIVQELLRRPPTHLPLGEPFVGAGVYVVYYNGPLALYAPIATPATADPESQTPIYVGKAVQVGRRRGADLSQLPGPDLFKRLNEHAASIAAGASIEIKDFWCRFLVVDDVWIGLAESLLIDTYRPLWNVVVDGFGNHAPGRGRTGQARSAWDELHPGRPWAVGLAPAKVSVDEIRERIIRHFELHPPTPAS